MRSMLSIDAAGSVLTSTIRAARRTPRRAARLAQRTLSHDREMLALAAGLATLIAAGAIGASLRGKGPTRLDRRVRRLARAARIPGDDIVIEVVRALGYPVTYMPLTLVAARLIDRRSDDPWRFDGDVLRLAPLVAWLVHRVLKTVLPRDRPSSQRHARNFSHAYPSGHTTGLGAVAMSAALALRRAGLISTPVALGIAAAAPLLVAATRVRSDEHWLTDVMGGWLVAGGSTALSVALRGAR